MLRAAQGSKLSNHPDFPYQLALATANNPDTLHFGKMRYDPDPPLFEQDLQQEVHDLLASDTVEITPHTSMPPGTHPLQSI
jgi:hypothetical protein